MKKYSKIQTVFFKDMNRPGKPPVFEYLKNNEWIWLEKVDGYNIRHLLFDGGVVR